jgi:hypothetical protein
MKICAFCWSYFNTFSDYFSENRKNFLNRTEKKKICPTRAEG